MDKICKTFQCRHHPRFLEVGIILTRSELVYDIEFVTNRIAKLNAVDEEGKQKKIAASITAEGQENKDYLDRLITSAVKKLRSSTSWASGERGGKVVSDMIPPCMDDWTFVFHVPLDWRGEADVLCSLCHDYVKNKVISDWMMLVAPKSGEGYETMADENLRDVKYELRKQTSTIPPTRYMLTGMDARRNV